ncbi:MAG: TRAP transporter small permease [Phycisphaerae bacterium]|jgi:TRAP-type C4-dicarboxylate transport system permease small subunit
MKTVKIFLDKVLEFIVSASMGLLVLDVIWQVFTRLVLQNPSPWTEEVAIILLVWVALLGAAVGLGLGAHLGIDYFASKMKEKTRKVSEVFVFALIFLFAAIVMVIGGIDLVSSTFELGQVTPQLSLPVGYVYIAVPVSGLFMMIYSGIGFAERLAAVKEDAV